MSKRQETFRTGAVVEKIIKEDKKGKKQLQHQATSRKENLVSVREKKDIEKELRRQVEQFDLETGKTYKHRETLERLVEKYSDNEIGKMFNVKRETIRYFRKKYNISPCPIRYKKRLNKYSLDVKFFENIETEYQAYILGFICADGYVHKNGKTVSIAIKQSDSQILEDIKKAMKTNAELKVKSKPSNQEDLYVLNILSKELVSDLAKLFAAWLDVGSNVSGNDTAVHC